MSPALMLRDPRVPQGIAVLAAAVLLTVSWQHGYVPRVRAVRAHREETAALTQRTAEVNAMLLAAGGQPAWTAGHEVELAQRRARIPAQEQLPQLLNQLVEALKAGELQLLNVAQGNTQLALEAAALTAVGGATYQRLPLTVTAEGRYATVVAALERLSPEAFPYLVRLEAVDLRRQTGDTPVLRATLTLSVYILGIAPATGASP